MDSQGGIHIDNIEKVIERMGYTKVYSNGSHEKVRQFSESHAATTFTYKVKQGLRSYCFEAINKAWNKAYSSYLKYIAPYTISMFTGKVTHPKPNFLALVSSLDLHIKPIDSTFFYRCLELC